jgi:hypothetical protein
LAAHVRCQGFYCRLPPIILNGRFPYRQPAARKKTLFQFKCLFAEMPRAKNMGINRAVEAAADIPACPFKRKQKTGKTRKRRFRLI